jgi:hypothetical protein
MTATATATRTRKSSTKATDATVDATVDAQPIALENLTIEQLEAAAKLARERKAAGRKAQADARKAEREAKQAKRSDSQVVVDDVLVDAVQRMFAHNLPTVKTEKYDAMHRVTGTVVIDGVAYNAMLVANVAKIQPKAPQADAPTDAPTEDAQPATEDATQEATEQA